MAYSFKTDVTEFEKSVEVRDGGNFPVLPKGFYEVELIGVKSSKGNAAKGYGDVDVYNLTLKFTDTNEVGAGQRIWKDVYLTQKWASGKNNFTLNQFIKAAGLIDDEGNVEIPDPDDLLDMAPVFGVKLRNRTIAERTDKDGTVHPDRNEVDGFVTLEDLEKRLENQVLEQTAEKVTPSEDKTDRKNGLFV